MVIANQSVEPRNGQRYSWMISLKGDKFHVCPQASGAAREGSSHPEGRLSTARQVFRAAKLVDGTRAMSY
jgi:hypothetical protein